MLKELIFLRGEKVTKINFLVAEQFYGMMEVKVMTKKEETILDN